MSSSKRPQVVGAVAERRLDAPLRIGTGRDGDLCQKARPRIVETRKLMPCDYRDIAAGRRGPDSAR